MKKIVVMAALLVMVALPVCAVDFNYCIDFFPVSISGKQIDDGYLSSSVSDSGWRMAVCGIHVGETTDYFSADIFNSDGEFYIEIYGHIVWDSKANVGYIQGATASQDDSGTVDTFYLDGTIKWSQSKSKYSLSGKAGETYSNNGAPWIVSGSIKSPSGYVVK